MDGLSSHDYSFQAQGRERKIRLRRDGAGRTYVRSGGKTIPVSLQFLGRTAVLLCWGESRFLFQMDRTPEGLRLAHGPDQLWIKRPASPASKLFQAGRGETTIVVKSQMPGLIAGIAVRENQLVKEGQTLLLVEAMKMQNPIKAPWSGKVRKLFVREGVSIESGAPLAEIERVKK